MNLGVKAWLAAALVALTMVAGVAAADEIPLVTGEQWTTSTEQMKKAYLIGMANVVQVEMAFAEGNPPSDSQSFLPRLVRGLKGQTLDSVRQAIDAYYASHPDRLQRPEIDTIWFELVVPGLEKNK